MLLYTKAGDKGNTRVVGGRLMKDDVRVEAYGTIDEANAFVGKVATELNPNLFKDMLADLEKIQHELFDCGSDLSNIMENKELKVTEDMVTYLETKIDELIEEAPELKRFILPGGSAPSASLHIARTVIRRAERHIVTLMGEEENVPETVLKYVNRVSDYFFAAARVVNARLKVADVEYVRSANVFRGNNQKRRDK